MSSSSRWCLLALALLACACAAPAREALPPPRPLREAESPLLAAVHRSADYLARACTDEGRFLYRVDVRDGRVLGGYNILRHAGAMYALATYEQRWPGRETRAALLRAARYLRREHIGSLDGMRAVWSEPGSRREAKLGGAGLALTALGELERIAPGTTPRAELDALARFVAFMQKPDGTFYSKYAGGDYDDDFVSLYYPGEAALGVLLIGEHRIAEKALLALAEARRGAVRVPADHWALLATARLPFEKLDGGTRAALLAHAVQIGESILAERVVHPAGSPLAGCFGDDGRTTPTATRLEGLLALLTMLPGDHPLRARIRTAAGEGVAFLLRAQVRDGPARGALPSAIDEHEARIDYTQHALSAWIQYLESDAAGGAAGAGGGRR